MFIIVISVCVHKCREIIHVIHIHQERQLTIPSVTVSSDKLLTQTRLLNLCTEITDWSQIRGREKKKSAWQSFTVISPDRQIDSSILYIDLKFLAKSVIRKTLWSFEKFNLIRQKLLIVLSACTICSELICTFIWMRCKLYVCPFKTETLFCSRKQSAIFKVTNQQERVSYLDVSRSNNLGPNGTFVPRYSTT